MKFTRGVLFVFCAAGLGACGSHRTLSVKRPAAMTPLDPSSMRQQMINAVDAGDGDEELHALRARIDANPQDLTARIGLADRYKKLGFIEVAIEHCRLACERAPDSDEAHLALARILRDAERPSEAAGMLSAFALSHPDAKAMVWGWVGLLRDETEDWKAGETAHRRALALEPGREDFHNNLGYCLLRQGRGADAAMEFRAALKLHPHSAISENNLALALAGERTESKEPRENKEALAHLQSVADPATAHSNLAVAMIEAGRFEAAHKEIEIALRYNRSHSAALNNLRVLSELEGRPAEIEASGEEPGGRWARAVAAWRHFWSGAEPDSLRTIKPDAPVASR